MFQGYIVYQATSNVVNPFVSYFDTTKMRVVAQSDLADNIDTLTNHYLDTLTVNCDSALMVEGNNIGIQHTYLINTDAFTGNAFQQGNTYCYYVFSYANSANKLGEDCNKEWPFLIEQKLSNGSGQGGGRCIAFNPTAISELSNNLNYKIYPNPVEKQLHIKLGTIEELIEVEIINVTGKKIVERKYVNSKNIELNVDDLLKGIYFMKISTSSGKKAVKFIRE